MRPGTGDPVAAGEVGEIVVTTFNPTYPLIRFATGDLSAVLAGTSPCGRTNQRIKGWLGRADQTTKVKGMFVHPEQIADIARRHPELQRLRLVVDNPCLSLIHISAASWCITVFPITSLPARTSSRKERASSAVRSFPAASATPSSRYKRWSICARPVMSAPVSYTHLDVYKRQVMSTGISYALIDKSAEDKLPLTMMGYGRTDAVDGSVFPYAFPLVTTYQMQASAIVKFLKEKGGLEGKKIVFLYHDSAYGKEPIGALQEEAKLNKFNLTLIPVAHPGNEQSAQWLQIRQENPDYVIFWGWGVMNQTALKAAQKVGFARDKMVGSWGAGSEAVSYTHLVVYKRQIM